MVIEMNLLIEACKEGYRDVVELLLTKGADVNAKDNDGETVLMWASREGHKEIVELLLNSGADVNARNDEGFTALILASFWGYMEIVELLLNNGADVNAKNGSGDTALMWACYRGHNEIVELLEKYIEEQKIDLEETNRKLQCKIESIGLLFAKDIDKKKNTFVNGKNINHGVSIYICTDSGWFDTAIIDIEIYKNIVEILKDDIEKQLLIVIEKGKVKQEHIEKTNGN